MKELTRTKRLEVAQYYLLDYTYWSEPLRLDTLG